MPFDSALGGGDEHPLAERGRRRERHARSARSASSTEAADGLGDVAAGVAAGPRARAGGRRARRRVNVAPSPSSTQLVDSASPWSAASRGTSSASSVAVLDVPAVVNGPGSSIVTAPSSSRTPVRKPIDERWPSPIWRTLITKRSVPGRQAGLVGCRDRRRVAQRGGLDGVLVGERRAEQQPALARRARVRARAGWRCGRRGAGRSPARSRWRPPKRSDDRGERVGRPRRRRARGRASTTPDARPSVLAGEGVAGHEQLGDTRDGIGRAVAAAARVASGSVITPAPARRRRACCSVEISASVDSAPWLRLAPVAFRPS